MFTRLRQVMFGLFNPSHQRFLHTSESTVSEKMISEADSSPAESRQVCIPALLDKLDTRISARQQFADAVANGNVEVVSRLLYQGVDPFDWPYHSMPLFVAARKLTSIKMDPKHDPCVAKSYLDIINYIIDFELNRQGAFYPTHKRYKCTESPLHYAVSNCDLLLVERFLELGADPNELNEKTGESPFHVACRRGFLEGVSIFFKTRNSVDVNKTTFSGVTPLYIAAEKGNMELVKFLLKQNADPTIPNSENITPVDIAKRKRHFQTVMLFSPPLRVLIDIIHNDAYWRSKANFKLCGVPDGVMALRKKIKLLQRKGYTEANLYAELCRTAFKSVDRVMGYFYLFTGYDSRSRAADDLYRIFERNLPLNEISENKHYKALVNDFSHWDRLQDDKQVFEYVSFPTIEP